jgi:hypothetical protein
MATRHCPIAFSIRYGVSIAAMTAFCLLRQRNLESEPNERGQCAAEAEGHCDHGRLHDPLGDFALPSQVSEVALRLDRLGRIDAKTNQRLLRRLFSRYARDVLDFISVHQSPPLQRNDVDRSQWPRRTRRPGSSCRRRHIPFGEDRRTEATRSSPQRIRLILE